MRLPKPLLDLNTTQTSQGLSKIHKVAALPNGDAVFYNFIYNKTTHLQVLKMNSEGIVTQTIYSCVGCTYITGLLVLVDHLYITHNNGTLLQTRVTDGHVLNTYTIPEIRWVYHSGSLYSKPGEIPDNDTILLCDTQKGEVFRFKLSTRQKKVLATNLSFPQSVSYFFKDNKTFFIVNEHRGHRMALFDADWQFVRNIGRYGTSDGSLTYPYAAVASDDNTIFVSDRDNHRVAEFSFDGTFLRHLLVRSDGVYKPRSMSYSYPYLWLVHGRPPKLYRYKIYE